MTERVLLAAIEAGGTTWVAALAWEDDMGSPFERLEVPTSAEPAQTISTVRQWLRVQMAERARPSRQLPLSAGTVSRTQAQVERFPQTLRQISATFEQNVCARHTFW